MISTEEQRRLNEELLRECMGYSDRDNKPDGAYIEADMLLFNINKIKRLIEMGADVNAKTKNDYTPLYYAVRNDNVVLVKLLIEMGADIGVGTSYGVILLHGAVRRNNPTEENTEIVKLLIDLGLDVNAKDYSGKTSLDHAVLASNPYTVRLLLKEGAK